MTLRPRDRYKTIITLAQKTVDYVEKLFNRLDEKGFIETFIYASSSSANMNITSFCGVTYSCNFHSWMIPLKQLFTQIFSVDTH